MSKELEKEPKEEKESERKNWWANPCNKLLVAIMVFAVIVRLYIFFSTLGQPLWWDEAGYMAKAQKIAFGWTWTDFWNPHKPILLSWMAVPLYKIGIGEIGIKFIIMLFSIAGVYLTFLVGKEFFNEKAAVIASFLMSVFWVSLFFTPRILTDLPAAVFLLLTIYYFSKGYIKKENPKYIWTAGIFFGLTFLMRVTVGIMLIPFLVYFFAEERLKFLKNKNIWIAILLIFIVILPFLIWLYFSYPAEQNAGIITKIYKPIDTFLGLSSGRFTTQTAGGGAMGFSGIFAYIKDQPYVFGAVQGDKGIILVLKYIPVLLLIAGLIFLFADLILCFDLVFKKEHIDLRKRLFILVAVILIFISFGYTRGYVEQRDMIHIAPFLFCGIGIALVKFSDYFDKYKKNIGIVVIILLLLLTAYFQLQWGIALTESKKTSYMPVKEASLWIKGNSAPSDVIYTESKMQNLYYAERSTLAFGSREGYDPWANKLEQEFMQEAKAKNAKFMYLSLFEGHPQWMYSNCGLQGNMAQFCPFLWASRYNETLLPINAWYQDAAKTTPILVLFQFLNYDFKA